MIIIIVSLTTNFIAAFHGLYLLAAYSHSFQFFLFSFRVEQVEKGLWIMSNKMCYPIVNACVANGGWMLKDLGTETNNPNPGRWNPP